VSERRGGYGQRICDLYTPNPDRGAVGRVCWVPHAGDERGRRKPGVLGVVNVGKEAPAVNMKGTQLYRVGSSTQDKSYQAIDLLPSVKPSLRISKVEIPAHASHSDRIHVNDAFSHVTHRV
jgi:hypothetical protein